MGGDGLPKTNHTERRLHKGTECGSLRKNVSVGAFKFPGEKKASKEVFGPFSQSKALVGALESKLTWHFPCAWHCLRFLTTVHLLTHLVLTITQAGGKVYFSPI